jgi:D-hydroxyproline dehydrogenase subunit alpha
MADSFEWRGAEGDPRAIPIRDGQSVAAALTEAGIREFRATRRMLGGAGRGVFCGMGVCQDCLVELDGTPNSRACMAKAKAGMVVRRQDSRASRGCRKAPCRHPMSRRCRSRRWSTCW